MKFREFSREFVFRPTRRDVRLDVGGRLKRGGEAVYQQTSLKKSGGPRLKPIDAYNDIAGRGRMLLRLYNGLVNTRKRGIRSDWRRSFNRLMRWPLNSNVERVDSRDAVVVLRDSASLQPDDFAADTLEDLLRCALVYGVSALDRYVHERVIKGLIAALREPDLNGTQRKLLIPVADVFRISDDAASKARAGRQARPANHIRKIVQEQIHFRPFQDWREVMDAFRILGIDASGQLQASLQVADITPTMNRLNEIVRRRNLIVHEGDLVRHERGGKVRTTGLEPKYVRDSLDFLDGLVGRLETIP